MIETAWVGQIIQLALFAITIVTIVWRIGRSDGQQQARVLAFEKRVEEKLGDLRQDLQLVRQDMAHRSEVTLELSALRERCIELKERLERLEKKVSNGTAGR